VRVDSGSLVITAEHVASLPLAVVIGANQGVYALAQGPALSHRVERRPHCRIVVWIERGGAPLVGHYLQVGSLTGSQGSDWLCLVGSVASAHGRLGQAYLGNLEYGPVIVMQVGSVAAGDVVRWRVCWDRALDQGVGLTDAPSVGKGRVLVKALETTAGGRVRRRWSCVHPIQVRCGACIWRRLGTM
jgi:hypothetical protein